MDTKIEKLRANDNYVLLYCKGNNGTDKLVNMCNRNKKYFWIVSQCSRKDRKKFSELWKHLSLLK